MIDHDIAQILAKLSICSEVSAANMDSSSRDSGHDIGGNRPPGGIDHKGDHEREWAMKSRDHFVRRLAGAYTERAKTEILNDMEAALSANKRQPKPTKQNEPEYGSPAWKRYISESSESYGSLASRFNVTRSYIQKIRRLYAT